MRAAPVVLHCVIICYGLLGQANGSNEDQELLQDVLIPMDSLFAEDHLSLADLEPAGYMKIEDMQQGGDGDKMQIEPSLFEPAYVEPSLATAALMGSDGSYTEPLNASLNDQTERAKQPRGIYHLADFYEALRIDYSKVYVEHAQPKILRRCRARPSTQFFARILHDPKLPGHCLFECIGGAITGVVNSEPLVQYLRNVAADACSKQARS